MIALSFPMQLKAHVRTSLYIFNCDVIEFHHIYMVVKCVKIFMSCPFSGMELC